MSALPADWGERLAMVPGRSSALGAGWPSLPSADVRRSAVLMLFSDGSPPSGTEFGADTPATDGAGPDVVLTERASTLRSHAGEVSFPGGRIDPADQGPTAAALREAREEIGVDPAAVDVLGVLPAMFLAPSRNIVTPVLARWGAASVIGPVDSAEVASVVRAPLAELVDPANRSMTRHPNGWAGPAFSVHGLFVWGFTAGLLARVLELAGLDQPWDRDRVVDLPAHVLAVLT